MDEVLLQVENLSVTLDGSPVLSGVSFSLKKGEFLTVLGPNGCGKTVLLKALLGLLPYEGRVKWHEKLSIGYLPQGLNQASVKGMPLSVSDFFRLKHRTREEASTYLSHVGLAASVLDKKAGHLSGGEFQRMLIAWVLVSRPNVLFLDEPTTAVDVAGGETILSLLTEIWREQKLTILTVTHDLNIVYAFSTHVLCLSRLGYSCYGVPKEVLTPDALKDMYANNVRFYLHSGGSVG